MSTAARRQPEPLLQLCPPDNWSSVLDDPAPRAVRWATRSVERLFSPDWSKWHYTEGNGGFTACRRPVIPFEVDNSPQDAELALVNCKACLAKMRPFTSLLAKMEAGTATAEDVGPEWQVDYCREYARTSGHRATFTPMEKGGWTTLKTTHDGGCEYETRVRKAQAMTAGLRRRGDAGASVQQGAAVAASRIVETDPTRQPPGPEGPGLKAAKP